MADSVACIVFKNSTVLLIKRRDIPVWVLPGGGIDSGETPEAAACREMEEETGCKAEIVRKIAEYTPTNKLAKFTHFYEMRLLDDGLKTGSETLDFAYFSLEKLPILPPPYEYWIADAAHQSSHLIRKPVEGVTYWVLLKLLIQHPILVGRFLLTKLEIHLNSKD